ncbi:MAG: SMP-30/gluconolactonase/LRE family protein [Acidimicrobiales bacterium]
MQIDTLIDGLVFPEGPRWRDGTLWFSDIWDDRVARVSIDGTCVTVTRLEQPSGLGWLPDGRLLVVAMGARQLMRLEPSGELVVHADLTPFADWPCNDMVVAADGTAYVGHFGWDRQHGSTEPRAASVLRVQPDGAVDVAADDMLFPNGMAITPDGATLIVAESSGSRVTAFDRAADGSLSNRRSFADFSERDRRDGHEPVRPDGICLDVDGALWLPDPAGRRVMRVLDGGTVTETHAIAGEAPLACAVGGIDGRTLFVTFASIFEQDKAAAARSGRIGTAVLPPLN